MDNLRKKKIGKLGEDLAAKFLTEKGYQVIDRNFLIRGGEIDIVALHRDTLVFVEVKTRSSTNYGLPEEAISHWKLQSLLKTAQFYQLNHPNLPEALRIDVVAVEFEFNGKLKRIELIENITG